MELKKSTIVGIAAAVLFFVSSHFLGWLNPVENLTINFVNLGSSKIYSFNLWLNETVLIVFKKNNLLDQLQQTEKKIIDCNFDFSELKRLKEENEKLRRELNFPIKSDYKKIGANVIGKNIDSIGTGLLIDIGSNDGIKENDPVIVGSGILVGKIAKVNSRSSLIRLINDNQSAIAATIENKDKSIGLVEGGYGLSVRMNFIPQNEVVNQGETVITSGLEENMPRGLIIGNIEIVEKIPQELFQQAVVRSVVNFQKIFSVIVLTRIET